MEFTSNPPFIDHYINQLISEDCIVELNKLGKDYRAEKQKITEFELQKNAGAFLYKTITGEKFPNSVDKQISDLDKKYKEEAKRIVTKHAEREGISFIEWKDAESEKFVQKNPQKSDKNLSEAHDRMTEKIQSFKDQSKDSDKVNEKNLTSDQKDRRSQFLKQFKETEQDISKVKGIEKTDTDQPKTDRELRLQRFKENFKSLSPNDNEIQST